MILIQGQSGFQKILMSLYTIILCTLTLCHHIGTTTTKKIMLKSDRHSLCLVDEKISKFLIKFIEQEFSLMNVNIIYDSPDTQCENVRQVFHHDLSTTTTTTVSFYNPNKQYDHELIGFHPHQFENWPELNLVILFNGKLTNGTVDKLVKLYHFKRQNSFTIFWQRESTDRMENLLEISALQRLKYKIELYTTTVGESLVELEVNSRCFYCDDGMSEMQTIATFTIQIDSSILDHDDFWLGTFPTKNSLFKDYTKNFYGKTLQVSLAKGIPAMMSFKRLKNGRIETSGGFQTQLFHMIKKKLNFSYNITVESSFGLEGPNGTFNGMVGAVQTGKADLGMGASFTPSRCRVAHYLTPNTFHLVTFITGNPRPRAEWQNIFLAFTPQTWLTVFCMAGFLVYPTFILANILAPPNQNKQPKRFNQFFISGISFLVRTIFEQKWTRENTIVRHNSIKVLALFWLIGMLVVRTEFKCNLINLTVSPPMESPPTTFYQLANSDYNIYTHYSGGSLNRIVRTTHSPTFDRITIKMKKETSIKKCLGKTLMGKAACISYEDDAIIEGHRYYSDPYGHVQWVKAPASAFNFFAGVILPKEAVYIDSMELIVSQVVDMGIAKRFHDEQYQDIKIKGKRWAKQRKDKSFIFYDSGHHFEKLELSHFLVPFFILLFGYLAAAIVCVLERKKEIQIPKLEISTKISFKSAVALIPRRIKILPSKISHSEHSEYVEMT